MTSTAYTERLITDIEKVIAIRATADYSASEINHALDHHLALAIQLINLNGESYLSYTDGTAVDLSQLLEEITVGKQRLIRRIQDILEEDPFISLPDNQSLAGELSAQLDLVHATAVRLIPD